jgi:hypothetical protein
MIDTIGASSIDMFTIKPPAHVVPGAAGVSRTDRYMIVVSNRCV